MVKKRIDERVCEECGKIILNRRIDAKKCLECRRKAQQEASQRIKEREKEERMLRKVEGTGIRHDIEREKAEQILKNLKEEFEKEEKPSEVTDTFSRLFLKPKDSHDYFPLTSGREVIKDIEIKPFKELIDKKIQEEKEKEELEKKGLKKFKTSYDSFF